MFASAGILWGAVTVYRGMLTWKKVKSKGSVPVFIILGAALVVCCAGYLIHRI